MKNSIPCSVLHTTRRRFLQQSAVAGATAFLPSKTSDPQEAGGLLPQAFTSLKPLGSRVKPISAEEFRGRIARAQQLMSDSSPKFDALFVAPGTSLYYFSGIRWWPSERLLALLIQELVIPS